MSKVNELNYVCKCNNCNKLYIDTNPQINAKQFDISDLSISELESIDDMRACPKCLTDEYLTDIDEIDLFEQYKMLPQEVQDVLEVFGEVEDYYGCKALIYALEVVGYSCEYGLDACPYNLHKIN